MALTDKLSAIGNAIREKTGKTELLTLDAMPLEIASITTGGGGIEVEPIVLTGNCAYICSGDIASTYIKLFGDTISTQNITAASSMFAGYKNHYVPFEINFKSGSNIAAGYLFDSAEIRAAPTINNLRPSAMNFLFSSCYYLRELPENLMDNWDMSYINTYAYGSMGNLFSNCYSLRSIPVKILNKLSGSSAQSSSYLYYSNIVKSNYALDEIVEMPVFIGTLTSNGFTNTIEECGRLKDFKFSVNEDNTPKTANWKNQTINLSGYVGSVKYRTNILNYNSGITADKEVKDDATYQALKDDPDWFTIDANYSRYNKTSAINTINTLPDTSAYLATAGGTNTIRFKGAAGALTDGGAINTLTAEEIAVATAKGWTVTLS